MGERSEVERTLGWISGPLCFESVEVSLHLEGIGDLADRAEWTATPRPVFDKVRYGASQRFLERVAKELGLAP